MTTETRKAVFPELIWAGTEHSLSLAIESNDRLEANLFGAQPEKTQEEAPYLFSMQGDIGVISIRGSLVNRDSPYNRYMNVTSYSDIRRAMVYGATQEGVKAILLDIDSGGGAVSGVADCAELITKVNDSVKPVYSFSGGTMASAAMWLGAAAGEVYVSASTLSGSIGIIATHTEYSKAMKEAGIGVTVLRAGEFKALANSFEPLTPAAEKQLQSQLNAAYGLFIGFMAERRNVSVPVADKAFGQGREFFGGDAVTAGLADGITNFDGMVSLIEKKVIDANRKREHTSLNYPQGQNMSRQALTDTQISAMAAGGGVNLTPEQVAAAEAAATAAAAVAAAVAAAAAPAAAAAAPAAAAPVSDLNAGLVTYLQAQVKDKDALLLSQGVELTNAKARVTTLEGSQAGLVKIAADSLSHMKVALGMKKQDFSALSTETLLAEHTAAVATFTAAYPVGGVAATSAETTKPVSADAEFALAQRVMANRYTPKK